MDFLDPEIEQYALEHSEGESNLLNEINRQELIRKSESSSR